ncbi:MAG: hypothetical protein AUH11_16935 [Acidobacteria bacterium 13_2_20CM_57_17]|nr:MAG: hypothetical protein AUH11_16935 [Acidobacteria bacterium 13_2_20CM_57_17]OLE15435.1 MAG: hypothetical protein AUG83_07060 [Acidobacteria bacterium 13_1_20CM_4_57_11]
MLSVHEIFLRLTVAAVLGAVIGIERDLNRRPAGVRTSLFVCLATALFTILSGEIAHRFGDTGSTRIASNIVQGIGFLGAGAILREAGGVVGMTTAATVFVEAAIGMAAGGGLYAVAVYGTGLVLFGLVCIGWAARRFHLKCRNMVFRVTASHAESVATEIQRLMAGMKFPCSTSAFPWREGAPLSNLNPTSATASRKRLSPSSIARAWSPKSFQSRAITNEQ